MFFEIEALDFLFLSDPQSHSLVDDQSHQVNKQKCKKANADDAHGLIAQLRETRFHTKESHGERAPNSADQVNRSSTDRVIDFDFIKKDYGKRNNNTSYGSDENRFKWAHQVSSGSDTHQTSENTVQHHG